MQANHLEARVRQEPGGVVLDLRGEINGFGQEALDAAYAEAEAKDPEIILLNFEEVDYINSTGIALIVGLLAKARASKRSSPSASGRRSFAPFVGEADVTVMHSVIVILGLGEIARAIFDNAAAAVAGMVRDAGRPVTDLGERCVGITMLGQTTPGVMRVREVLLDMLFHRALVQLQLVLVQEPAANLVLILDFRFILRHCSSPFSPRTAPLDTPRGDFVYFSCSRHLSSVGRAVDS